MMNPFNATFTAATACILIPLHWRFVWSKIDSFRTSGLLTGAVKALASQLPNEETVIEGDLEVR